jgi:hypothetical protein
MLIDVLEFLQDPKGTFRGVIESTVWLVIPDDSYLLGIQAFDPMFRYRLGEVIGRRANGKAQSTSELVRDRLTLFLEMGFSQAIDEIVECRTQTMEAVAGVEAQEFHESLSDDSVVEMLRSLVIGLSPDTIMTSAKGVIDCRVENVVVSLRPI